MKKLFISLVALVAVLASCSKSAVVEVPYENIPVSFSSYNGRLPQSKASALVGEDSLGWYGFQVYAFLNPTGTESNYSNGNQYMDKTVKYAEKTTTWEYDGVAYWPGKTPLDFIAYGLNTNWENCSGDDNILSYAYNETTKKPELTVNIPAVVAHQKDVLVANPHSAVVYGAGQYSEGNVKMVFNHMLSRISFSLKTKEGNTVPVTFKKIEIAGKFASTGIIDLSAPAPAITPNGASDTTYAYLAAKETFTSDGQVERDKETKEVIEDRTAIHNNSMCWTFNNETTEAKQNYDKAEDTDGTLAAQAKKNEENRYMMIIPTEDHKAKLTVEYFLPYAGTFNADKGVPVVDLSAIKFEAGKAYNFVLEVSTNSIEFSVEITPWVDATEDKTDAEGNVTPGDYAGKQVIKLN